MQYNVMFTAVNGNPSFTYFPINSLYTCHQPYHAQRSAALLEQLNLPTQAQLSAPNTQSANSLQSYGGHLPIRKTDESFKITIPLMQKNLNNSRLATNRNPTNAVRNYLEDSINTKFPNSRQNPMNNGKRKRSWSRAVFSNLQRKGLEIQFQQQKYITKPDRRKLAARLNLTDAQVKVWFQNRRMKWRHTRENLLSEEEKKSTTQCAQHLKAKEGTNANDGYTSEGSFGSEVHETEINVVE